MEVLAKEEITTIPLNNHLSIITIPTPSVVPPTKTDKTTLVFQEGTRGAITLTTTLTTIIQVKEAAVVEVITRCNI